jgi:CBS-domain-containing membrane protein
MASPSDVIGVPRASAARARAGGILLAALGTFVALALIGLLASLSGAAWVLGSFGASCVLLFGFPQGPFSQPRNIVGGHVLTSCVGLVFLNAFGPGWLPMAAAGACAVGLMMWTRTVHPPAGSNPVIIFMAHPGWPFLLLPTASGAVLLVVVGWMYWRVQRRGAWPVSWWR